MGISERKEREKQEMKSLILETATQMFLEHGFEKTSLRNIAEKIEYSPATIYLYYKDKNQLFYDVHEKGFELLSEKMTPLMQIENPLERLYKMGEIYLDFAFHNPEYYDLMFIMTAPMEALHDDNWDCGFANYEMLRQTIAECMEKGLIKKADLEVTTVSVFSFVHGLVSLAIRQRFKMYPEETLPELFRQSIDNILNLMKA
ncbi:TetR/AcrR family transcriptional regulator [Cytophagaceae bacterium DM2B3-1]|uniref:TetR/AcrR family transcriptional regulator n=1 Tax=Xanthocytophaga flava TaxID=3048013 RepID=A0ABT7CDX9_9BACT|nr:TetR/AcrR family transcriptional regulator [Xanthocytophaga flavus]MDJ1472667.1 TetR/AcrR family transcriptional regulator [Xanthocytophaga flavus]MDJ1491847.1 TetR/AcrR family transcriptional regulator [Xanthocytophaga flavus]